MTFSPSQSVVVGSALPADLLKSREATVYGWTETTPSLTCWTFYLLYLFPELQNFL